MSCKLEYRFETPTIMTKRMSSRVFSGEICTSLLTVNLGSPIAVIDTKVNFDKDAMKIGEWYPFQYRNETHLAVKTSEKTIDIYKVKK